MAISQSASSSPMPSSTNRVMMTGLIVPSYEDSSLSNRCPSACLAALAAPAAKAGAILVASNAM
jgi:hypothetical protein